MTGPAKEPYRIPLRVRLSYWLRPYDAHLDRRRWRWQESGCSQSRRAVARVLGAPDV